MTSPIQPSHFGYQPLPAIGFGEIQPTTKPAEPIFGAFNDELVLSDQAIAADTDDYQPAPEILIYRPDQSIIPEDSQKEIDRLVGELDKIFDVQPAPISKDDQVKIDSINKRIDEIFGVKTPTQKQEKEIDSIFRKIDRIYEDGTVTTEESKTLESLESKLDEIFGVPKEKLTEAEQKELDSLFTQLDKFYQPPQLTNSQLARVEEIEKRLDAIFKNLGF